MRAVVRSLPAYGHNFITRVIRARARQSFRSLTLRAFGRLIGRSPVSGPYQVERSLVAGLRSLGWSVEHNPRFLPEWSDIHLVPSGLDAFSQSLAAKARGKVGRVIAGPNLCMNPADLRLSAQPSLPDCFVQPSEWAKARWLSLDKDFPVPVAAAPAGVDVAFWSCSSAIKCGRLMLFYNKTGDENLEVYKEAATKLGFKAEVLAYGRFEQAEYFAGLSRASCLVYFSRSESQGIALFEAWSMNVPTFVFEYPPDEYGSSPAPYLCPDTGSFFKTPGEFVRLCQGLQKNSFNYRPREWIQRHGSDLEATRELLRLVGIDSPS